MTTVEKSRDTRTEAAEIMPFGGWETAPAPATLGNRRTVFRFPAADDPAPAPARLLAMALWSAALGLAGVGIGMRVLVKIVNGAEFWYVPTMTFFGLLSVTLVVGSFLSIHRRWVPWLLLAAATVPLAVDVLIAVLY
ncbi:hypothetical protein GCM10010172_10860 [Paractinoplanes ferrugineus]|uniref:Uncharacterized protein n=1 Tax=Paractinoplanes ferrugineus TaxID=113564 RepID=A0A919IWB8_9ACTN|nr:hypothetical protein [Actinoplanes ferrugineus]GIE09650.1 hypothetical protein Afe05nite_14900 [Actinoplanes ferrugineus]